MRLSNVVPSQLGGCVVILGCLAARVSGYFVITEPSKGATWMNGASNLVTWRKGLFDGIDLFDVEMAQLSRDGLTLVARDVPSASSVVNIFLQDVPPGDDYFLIFINSTHGVMHATSQRFTILPSSGSPNASAPQPDGKAATITVSGAPDPAKAFATTFPASSNAGVRTGWNELISVGGLAGAASACACVVGAAAWTLL